MYTSDSAAATPETLSVIGRFGGKANSGGRGGGDNRLQGMCTTTASHFHTVELLKSSYARNCFLFPFSMAMSFSVRATPLRPSSSTPCCLPSYDPTTSGTYPLTQANQFERNYDARRLCNWEARRHDIQHADGLYTRACHHYA